MSTEESKSNIQILDNGGFDISNQTTKEQSKAYFVKLVTTLGTRITIKHIERVNKTKWKIISPSGLKKKRQNNERQKWQRTRKRVKEKESAFVWLK